MRVGVLINHGEDVGIKPCFPDGWPRIGTTVYIRQDSLAAEHRDKLDSSVFAGHASLVSFGVVRESDASGEPCIHFQGIWEEGAPLFIRAGRQDAERRVLALVDRYWDLAYQEGKEGRTHDTPEGSAQAVRSELEEAIRFLR